MTTILTLLNREGINRFRVDQAIIATLNRAIEDPIGIGQRYALFPRELNRELVQKSEEFVTWTADFGTAVHWWIQRKLAKAAKEPPPGQTSGFNYRPWELAPIMPFAEEVATGFLDWFPQNGYEFTLSEHRFARPDLGYAGSVDLVGTHYGYPCIVDVKTQSLPINFYSPEYPLQLAGYDCGIEPSHIEFEDSSGSWQVDGQPRERISIILNRDKPGEVHQKLWVDKGSDIAATNRRWDEMWATLVELWFMVNKYDPRKGSDADSNPED